MSLQDFSTTNEAVGIISSQKVGPTVANDMRTDAVIAVLLSLIAMFLYILIRFHNIAFSVGALAAVAFTAFTIIGFYSIFYGVFPFAMEIDQSFIAAILTVIGYQINDTVVVFDRVRENVGLYPKQDFYTNINNSINSTLGRTLMTSGSTLLVLLVHLRDDLRCGNRHMRHNLRGIAGGLSHREASWQDPQCSGKGLIE